MHWVRISRKGAKKDMKRYLANQADRQVVVDRDSGQYRVRLMDNTKGADCTYPSVEVLRDGPLVATTYRHWLKDEMPFIVSVRLKLEELDCMYAGQK